MPEPRIPVLSCEACTGGYREWLGHDGLCRACAFLDSLDGHAVRRTAPKSKEEK